MNLSPKGAADLHVVDRNTLAYFDYAGSGNETARHGMAGGPVTVMVTSFDEDAAIVRLYGRACAKPLDESVLADRAGELRAVETPTPERQVIEITVERTQTSCGYGVPVYKYQGDRTKASEADATSSRIFPGTDGVIRHFGRYAPPHGALNAHPPTLRPQRGGCTGAPRGNRRMRRRGRRHHVPAAVSRLAAIT